MPDSVPHRCASASRRQAPTRSHSPCAGVCSVRRRDSALPPPRHAAPGHFSSLLKARLIISPTPRPVRPSPHHHFAPTPPSCPTGSLPSSAHNPCRLVLHASDKFGNRLGIGGAAVTARASGASAAEARISANVLANVSVNISANVCSGERRRPARRHLRRLLHRALLRRATYSQPPC